MHLRFRSVPRQASLLMIAEVFLVASDIESRLRAPGYSVIPFTGSAVLTFRAEGCSISILYDL